MLKITRKSSVIVLAVILSASLTLRLWGINFSHKYNPDEKIKIELALGLIEPNGVDLNPRFFKSPNSLLYSFFALYFSYYNIGKKIGNFKTVNSFKDYYNDNPLIFFIIARVFVVIMSLATVLLVFFIGRALFNLMTGIIAASFIAVIPLHVIFSHYAKEDIPVTFWVSLSFFFSIYIAKKGRMLYYILAGLIAGVAMSTKWIGVNCICFVLSAHLINYLKNKNRISDFFSFHKKFILAIIFLIVGFLMCSPYILIERDILSRDLGSIFNSTFHGRYGVPAFNPILKYPRFFLKLTWFDTFYKGMGALISIFCLTGVVYSLIKHTYKDFLLLSFIIPFSLQIWTNFNSCDRYYLPAIPFLLIIGARFLFKLYEMIVRERSHIFKQVFFIIFLSILLVQPLSDTLRYDFYMIPDTRTLASQWISEYIPKGSIIAAEGIRERAYMPPISTSEYKVIEVDLLADYPMDYYYQMEVEYIVASSACYARYQKEITPERFFFYKNLFKNYEIIKEFRPSFRKYAFHNPTITILKINSQIKHGIQ